MEEKLQLDAQVMVEVAENVDGSRILPGRMRVFSRSSMAIGVTHGEVEDGRKGDGLGCWAAAMLKGRRARQRVCAHHGGDGRRMRGTSRCWSCRGSAIVRSSDGGAILT